MAREIAPDVHWIQECGSDRAGYYGFPDMADPPDWWVPGEEVHNPQNACLFVGEESLLFETLSPARPEQILDELDELLDEGLDYLVVSHPDVPHAGNAHRILREHPTATLVGPAYGRGHELYHLDDARLVEEGDTIDLGGFVVDFHEAIYLDAPVSLWMSERTTNALFTVDWMGFPHTEAECARCVDEMERDGLYDRLYRFHRSVLFWFEYLDVAKTQATNDYIAERYDPDILFPSHGQVVREDAEGCLDHMNDVVEAVADPEAARERGLSIPEVAE